MLQIVLAWRLFSPLVLGHGLVVLLRSWIAVSLRLLLALCVAVGVYGLTMLVTVELYSASRPMAALVYAAGFGLATWLATCAAVLSARVTHRRLIANVVATIAMVLPIALAMQSELSDRATGLFLVYAIGAGLGGLAAIRLLSNLCGGFAPMVPATNRRDGT